jgi:hypothetical protein
MEGTPTTLGNGPPRDHDRQTEVVQPDLQEERYLEEHRPGGDASTHDGTARVSGVLLDGSLTVSYTATDRPSGRQKSASGRTDERWSGAVPTPEDV